MKLLFRIAEWHGLAKLRMHTEVTLARLEQVTTDLGHLMRDFWDKTCPKFNTTDLAHEVEARNCRNARKKSMKVPNQSRKVKTLVTTSNGSVSADHQQSLQSSFVRMSRLKECQQVLVLS